VGQQRSLEIVLNLLPGRGFDFVFAHPERFLVFLAVLGIAFPIHHLGLGVLPMAVYDARLDILDVERLTVHLQLIGVVMKYLGPWSFFYWISITIVGDLVSQFLRGKRLTISFPLPTINSFAKLG
tara:strand:- start:320 stop:694 length:375 start_codon:yes stop_codon:yes gene_type:complete